MTAPPPLKNASDAYVSEKYPAKNYNAAQRMYLADNSAADTRYGYIYFGVPSGMAGTTLQVAKLRVYSGQGWAGSVTLSLQRLSSKFSVNRVNWNNKPGVTGAVKTLNKTGANGGVVWEFDILDVMQQVADGAPFYGFRLSATNSTAKWLYSAQGPEAYRPELELQWSDAPDQPERLTPDNGLAVSVAKPTLKWDFVDPSGDQTMASANLRLFSSLADANANSSPILDINYPTAIPQVDLDDTAYGGLAADAQLWWRVQNIDGVGIPSPWSDVADTVRKTHGTLTITNPAADPNDFVNEATPPFSWTFTGRTQERYRVYLCTPEQPGKRIWDTGEVTSTDTSVTPPAGKLTEVGKTYRVVVEVLDTLDRATLPDDSPWVTAFRDFTFDLSNTVSVVTNFEGTTDYWRNRITFEWDDATAPDTYVLLQDGKQVEEMYPVDVLESGTHYSFTWDEAKPRVDHTWSIARKVNGVTSSDNPTVVGQTKPITTTLSDPDNTDTIFLFNPDVAAEKTESSDVHYILGSAPPVLVTQAQRGYEGQITGVLLNDTVPGLTAAAQLSDFITFKENPGVVRKLVWVDKVMRVVIYDCTDTPIPYPDGTVEYLVNFRFFQVDF